MCLLDFTGAQETGVLNCSFLQRENIYTIPNFLCVSRIILSPYLGMLIVQAEFQAALAVLGIAATTDLVIRVAVP